jgi:hypothetical protein
MEDAPASASALPTAYCWDELYFWCAACVGRWRARGKRGSGGASATPPSHNTPPLQKQIKRHAPGEIHNTRRGVQPIAHFESSESKRRAHNLIAVSGLLDQLLVVKARQATRDELLR